MCARGARYGIIAPRQSTILLDAKTLNESLSIRREVEERLLQSDVRVFTEWRAYKALIVSNPYNDVILRI